MASGSINLVPHYNNRKSYSGSATCSSNNATLSWSADQWGEFLYVSVAYKATTNIAAGGTINGTLTNFISGYHPVTRGLGWNSSSLQVLNVDNTGGVFIRFIAAAFGNGNTGTAQVLMCMD